VDVTPNAAWEADSERVLRAVESALENENYKKASAVVSVELKKHGRRAALVAYSALLEERNGSREAALAQLQTVLDSKCSDVRVLNIASLVLRSLSAHVSPRQLAALNVAFSALLAAAAAADARNEELSVQLFFWYGRCRLHALQQQTAMRLYNFFKKEKYLQWSAVSLLTQLAHQKHYRAFEEIDYHIVSSAAQTQHAAPGVAIAGGAAAALAPQPDGGAADTQSALKLLQLSEMMIKRSFPKDAPIKPDDAHVFFHLIMRQAR
jgi:hypothetical protein